MGSSSINVIELFSGVGMLGEGLRAGFRYMGIETRTICHVEREAYPCAVLVARMEEGSLDAAPIWSDVTTFNAKQFHGKVDCIAAGFPCQDLSVAGKREGLDGKRSGLFFEITRIAADSGAWFIFLENVAGIASATATVMDEAEGELDERAAARVLGELADLGWNAEWITISASDVGASHGRARWFCIAWRMGDATGCMHSEVRSVSHRADSKSSGASKQRDVANTKGRGSQLEWIELSRGAEAESASEQLGNTKHARLYAAEIGNCAEPGNDGNATGEIATGESTRSGFADGEMGNTNCEIGRSEQPAGTAGSRRGRFAGTDSEVANTSQQGSQGNQQRIACDCDRGGAEAHGSTAEFRHDELFAPGPNDPRWGEIISREPYLAPALESDFCSVVNGLAFDMGDSRAARLKCVGNGVVPAQAGCAVVILARRAGIF